MVLSDKEIVIPSCVLKKEVRPFYKYFYKQGLFNLVLFLVTNDNEFN